MPLKQSRCSLQRGASGKERLRHDRSNQGYRQAVWPLLDRSGEDALAKPDDETAHRRDSQDEQQRHQRSH